MTSPLCRAEKFVQHLKALVGRYGHVLVLRRVGTTASIIGVDEMIMLKIKVDVPFLVRAELEVCQSGYINRVHDDKFENVKQDVLRVRVVIKWSVFRRHKYASKRKIEKRADDDKSSVEELTI